MTTSYCRLFLVAPVTSSGPDILVLATSAIQAGDIACVLLTHEDSVRLDDSTRELIAHLQQADIAVVLEGDCDVAMRLGADGVQLENPDARDIKQARAVLGEDAIVGASVGDNRHAAMVAGEAGASYVAFSRTEQDEPAGHWWAAMFEVPCVQAVTDFNEAKSAISAGVEFIAVRSELSGDTAQMVADYNALIEELEGVSN